MAEPISEFNSINKALVLYIGHGIHFHPEGNIARLEATFGSDEAKRFEKEIKSLYDELDNITVAWMVHDLASGAKWSVAQLRLKHPELDDAGSAALEWLSSYSLK